MFTISNGFQHNALKHKLILIKLVLLGFVFNNICILTLRKFISTQSKKEKIPASYRKYIRWLNIESCSPIVSSCLSQCLELWSLVAFFPLSVINISIHLSSFCKVNCWNLIYCQLSAENAKELKSAFWIHILLFGWCFSSFCSSVVILLVSKLLQILLHILSFD